MSEATEIAILTETILTQNAGIIKLERQLEQRQTDLNDLMQAIKEIYGDEAVKEVANKAMSYRGLGTPLDIYQTVDSPKPEKQI